MTSTERQASLITARGVLGMESSLDVPSDKDPAIVPNDCANANGAIPSQIDANDISQIFTRLEQRGFVLRRVEHSAILAITGGTFAPHRLRNVTQQQLQDDIQQFSSRFFETDIPERLHQWTSLMNRAGEFPPLLRRLNELQPGLNLQVPTNPANEHQKQILEFIVELFYLPAYRRVARRRRIVDELAGSGEIRYWRSAMMTLDRNHADFCRLTPDFCARVEQLEIRAVRPSENQSHERGLSPTILAGMMLAVGLMVVNQISPLFPKSSALQTPAETLPINIADSPVSPTNEIVTAATPANFRLFDLLETPTYSLGSWRTTTDTVANTSISMGDEKWQQAYERLTQLVAALRQQDTGNDFLQNASDVQLIDAVVANTEVFRNQFPESNRLASLIDELCECGRILGYNTQKGDVMPNMMMHRARASERLGKQDFRSLVGQPLPEDWDNSL